MRETKIIFSQKLGIEAAEFVAVWNNTHECRDIAEARLAQPAKTQFVEPSILGAVVEFVVGASAVEFAAGAIAGGVLHDSVKAGVKICVAKMKKTVVALKFKDIEQPDGSELTKASPEKDDIIGMI